MNDTTNPQAERLLRTLGLAARSGNIAFGCDGCCEAMKQGRARLVIAADGIAANTKKRIEDRSAFYGVRLVFPGCSPEQLGRALGKKGGVAAAAVTDASLARAVILSYEKQ